MRNLNKFTIATFILLIITKPGVSQFLTQSAEGKSSIPLPLNGMGVSFDITKAEIALGINNYQSALDGKRKYFLGLNLTGKNSEGFGNLFSSGDIVPEGNLLCFAGLTTSNHSSIIRNFNESKAKLIILLNQKLEKELFEKFRNRMANEIISLSGFINDEALTPEQLSTLKIAIVSDLNRKILATTGIDPGTSNGLDDVIKNYKYNNATDLKDFKNQLNDLYVINKELYSKERKEKIGDFYKIYSLAHKEYLDSQKPMRATIFLQGGINARSFTRFLGLSTPDFSKSFQDTLFRGGIIGLGVNLQYKNFWLGITYSALAGDNFQSLKGKEYTYRITDTSGTQTLYRDKKITAFSGAYSRVKTNQLNIDLVGDFKLSDTSRLLGVIYLRGSLNSKNTDALKNYVNIGTSAYFVNKKGKFLGGIYVELPDINNNFEKAKPANEINIREPLKKLSFGVVSKFSLSSIFTWSNRPAKTD